MIMFRTPKSDGKTSGVQTGIRIGIYSVKLLKIEHTAEEKQDL